MPEGSCQPDKGGPIYKGSMEQARSSATLPGRKPLLPMIHVNFSSFGSGSLLVIQAACLHVLINRKSWFLDNGCLFLAYCHKRGGDNVSKKHQQKHKNTERQQPHWRSISFLPSLAQHLDDLLATDVEQYESLLEVKPQLWVLDDYTVHRVKQVFRKHKVGAKAAKFVKALLPWFQVRWHHHMWAKSTLFHYLQKGSYYADSLRTQPIRSPCRASCYCRSPHHSTPPTICWTTPPAPSAQSQSGDRSLWLDGRTLA
jgi:hypothetical protein